MSDSRSQGGGAGVVLVVVVLGGIMFLGLGCLAAGFLFVARSAPMPVATTGTAVAPGPNFAVQSAGASRLADGSYNIFLVGTYAGGGTLEKLNVTDVRLLDVPDGACSVRLPAGPPYPRTVDIVVHTRPLPADQKTVQLNYKADIEGSQGFGGTFGMSSSGTMTIDIKPQSATEPEKGTEPAKAATESTQK